MTPVEGRVVRLLTCRASIELQARRPLTPTEEDQFRAAIPGVGLAGAPFDDASFIYPLRIPREPRVVVLGEAPRRVSLRVLYKQGLCVGVVADPELEAAYTTHPGSFLYVVGALQEHKKGDKTFLDVRPRGWFVVEVGEKLKEEHRVEKRKTNGGSRTRTKENKQT